MAWLREQGVKVNETGKSIAIIGTSSPPPDAVPKPDAPTTPKTERKPGESMREYCNRILGPLGAIDKTSEKPGSVSAMIGTGKPSKPKDDEHQEDASKH